jgi:DNA repair protein RadC
VDTVERVVLMEQGNLFENYSRYYVTTYLMRDPLIKESGQQYWIKSPEDICKMVTDHKDLENCDREHFIVAYLNRKGALNAVCTISIGGLHSSIVHPREVFKPAILTSSASVILIHNHPSGDPTPSREDVETTRRLIDAGKILGIEVLDHVIIGVGNHVSLKAKGLI